MNRQYSEIRTITDDDYRLNQPSDRSRDRPRYFLDNVREDNRRHKVDSIVEDLIKARMKEQFVKHSSPPRDYELFRTIDKLKIREEMDTKVYEDEFSFERTRPMRTEPNETYQRRKKAPQFYLNLNMQNSSQNQHSNLAEVKILLQCVIDKIGRNYTGDLRKAINPFSQQFVKEMRSFLIDSRSPHTQSRNFDRTPEKKPTTSYKNTKNTTYKQLKSSLKEPTTDRKQRYYSTQMKKVAFAPSSNTRAFN